MSWPPYFILAYLAVGLEIGLAPHLSAWGASPNLVLMAVVFIAVNAPRDAALLGCFALGAMQDLVTADALGLYAFSYGLFALIVGGAGQAVYRGHPLTHFALTLFGGIIAAMVIRLHGWAPNFHGEAPPALGALLWSAVYSAILSPLVLGLLHRMKSAFAFQAPRRRMRG